MYCGRPAYISLLAQAWFFVRRHRPSSLSLARCRPLVCSSRARVSWVFVRALDRVLRSDLCVLWLSGVLVRA